MQALKWKWAQRDFRREGCLGKDSLSGIKHSHATSQSHASLHLVFAPPLFAEGNSWKEGNFASVLSFQLRPLKSGAFEPPTLRFLPVI